MSKGKRLTEELIFKMLKEIDAAASIASVDWTRGDADQPWPLPLDQKLKFLE